MNEICVCRPSLEDTSVTGSSSHIIIETVLSSEKCTAFLIQIFLFSAPFCFLFSDTYFYAFFMFWLDLSINIHEYLFSYPLDRKSVKEHGLMSGLFRDIHSHRRNAIKNTKTNTNTNTNTKNTTTKRYGGKNLNLNFLQFLRILLPDQELNIGGGSRRIHY